MQPSITGLTTDLYELTMMQGYFLSKNNPNTVFEMFFRKIPFQGGFAIFAGVDPLLEHLQNLRFTKEDLQYLGGLGYFKKEFIDYLKDFRFTGNLWAAPEGTTVFPNEPLIRVEAPLIEAQLIESLLLNTVNFQTLIATKAARVYLASGKGKILEFGLRRAQGIDGAHSASRAAYIGGALATSNSQAGMQYNIPVSGTMAHSWIMSFPSELEAFRTYASYYPNNCTLLIDTYDALGSGIEHAITVGKELQEQGKNFGIRIDSGDLEYISKEVRKRLDDAGLPNATIAVSNDLTEEIIQQLILDEAPIDLWGVGTHLATGGSESSLSGVYKMVAKEEGDGTWRSVVKLSNNVEKMTNPGVKQVYRFYNTNGKAAADYIALAHEAVEQGEDYTFHHPRYHSVRFQLKADEYTKIRPLLQQVMQGGTVQKTPEPLAEIRSRALTELETLHKTHERITNPHVYKVSLSEAAKALKEQLIEEKNAPSKHP